MCSGPVHLAHPTPARLPPGCCLPQGPPRVRRPRAPVSHHHAPAAGLARWGLLRLLLLLLGTVRLVALTQCGTQRVVVVKLWNAAAASGTQPA